MEKGEQILREVETDLEELRKKVREHRKQQWKRLAIVVGCCVAVFAVFYIVSQVKTYSKYKVTESIDRADTSATKFSVFDGKILKYSNDGAIYTDVTNNVIWNQSFEMDSPMKAENGTYVAFADVGGQEIYVMDEMGLQGTIHTNMAIKKIDISNQGIIAVLMQNQRSSYIALYNIEGEKLAEGGIHMENSGYPMDVAISDDGKKLALAILDVASGSVKTTLSFYDFGTIGQNQIDNLVNTYSYAGSVIPQIEYVDDGTLLAFADNGVMIFRGTQIPENVADVLIPTEIKSVFYEDSHFGLVILDPDVQNGRKLLVYDLNGTELMGVSLDMNYDDVYFLNNHEVCVQNSEQCQIYTIHGVKKFESMFDTELYYVMKRLGVRNYTILKEDITEEICCKFFSSTRFEEEPEIEVDLKAEEKTETKEETGEE